MTLLRLVALHIVSLSLLSPLLFAQEKVHWDVVSKIREESFERSKAMDYVWYLSDVIGPAGRVQRHGTSPGMGEREDG